MTGSVRAPQDGAKRGGTLFAAAHATARAGQALALAIGVALLTGALMFVAPATASDTDPTLSGHGFYLTVRGPNQPAVQMYGESFGDHHSSSPDRRTIVLLHGLGASTYSWRRVIPELTRQFRVISLDLRGHGKSDKPFDQAYAPTAQAELVRDAMRQLKLRNVVLTGHSFGGLVALIATLQANAALETRIRKLVLLNAPAFPQPYSVGVRFLRQPILPYVALNLVPPHVSVSLALMAEAFGMPHITEDDIKFYAQPLLDTGARHALIATARQIQPSNTETIVHYYPTIKQPTELIWCRIDQVVPLSTGERLARTLPRARLTVLEGCDHATPEQKPGPVAEIIRRFAGR